MDILAKTDIILELEGMVGLVIKWVLDAPETVVLCDKLFDCGEVGFCIDIDNVYTTPPITAIAIIIPITTKVLLGIFTIIIYCYTQIPIMLAVQKLKNTTKFLEKPII